MSKDQRDRQAIGIRGYEVFMRDSSVVTTISKGQLECIYAPNEALALLAWLYLHRDELYQVALMNEVKKVHCCGCSTPRPDALS